MTTRDFPERHQEADRLVTAILGISAFYHDSAAALVTDGVVRDIEGVLGTGLPVWCDGYAAPPSVAGPALARDARDSPTSGANAET